MDNIDNLLFELKRILSLIDDNYVNKIESILDGESEYDRLFYHLADKFNIDKDNSKQKCIDRINDVVGSYNIKDYFLLKNIDDNAYITDLYRLIDDSISEFYGDIDSLQKLIEGKNNIIYGINFTYGIKKREELNYIKLYLSHIFYSYMVSYIDIVSSDDYYIDEDTRYVDIYKLLNNIADTKEVIDIFNYNIDEILDIYDIYLGLDKHGRDLIHLKALKSDHINKAINICPFSITMYKDSYNMYYKSEKLKSIEIGNITLTIIDDMIKDSYDYSFNINDVYKRTVKIIKGSNKEYDIFKWFNYLTANVYENIINKDNIDNDEKIFLSYISNDITNIVNNDYLLEYVLYKFYEFNNEIYDVKSLKDLRNRINPKDKVIIKKINPYYDDID